MACVSVRVCVDAFRPTANMRRVWKTNRDLIGRFRPAQATSEQYSLFRRYLDSRHSDGGMAHMSVLDYALMVEDSHVESGVVEYRRRGPDSAITGRDEGGVVACTLTDLLSDGLSMVYSFFDPGAPRPLARHLHDPRAHRAGAETRQALRVSWLLGRWLAEDGLQGALSASGAAFAARLGSR